MKKFLVLSLLFIAFVSSVVAHDFRKADWGMSKEQVKNIEVNKLFKETDEFLAFNGIIGGYECIMYYNFAYDKLISARYIITQKRDKSIKYIDDYELIKSGLNAKYGIAKEDETVWKSDMYRKDYNNWGEALIKGQLILFSSWLLDNTSIFYTINASSGDLEHILEYNSRNLSPLGDRLRYKRALSIFSDEGFRKSKWGNSKNYVKDKEHAKIVDNKPNAITYRKNIGRFDVLFSYLFTNNKLTSGVYIINNKYSDNLKYVYDYDQIKLVLTNKYGKPNKDVKDWKIDTYRDDFKNWGKAVEEGMLTEYAIWEIPNTIVTLKLTSNGNSIRLTINYLSTELKDYKEKVEKHELLKDL